MNIPVIDVQNKILDLKGHGPTKVKLINELECINTDEKSVSIDSMLKLLQICLMEVDSLNRELLI